MLNFRNPWWLTVTTILPVAILFWIFYGTFQVIESLLSPHNTRIWIIFGSSLGALWVIHSIYAIYCILTKRQLNKWYAFGSLILYAPFLYLYFVYYDRLIPWSIPAWMVSGNLILYAGSFLMPTLVHSLFILVLYFTKKAEKEKSWVNFLFAISIPVLWYVLFLIIFPLWRRVHDFETHFIVVITMSLTAVFLFFVIRGVYVLALKKESFFKSYEFVSKIIIAIAFPIAGLVVNNDMFFDFIFGNFSDPWFFLLAGINGIAVCIPDRDNKYFRLVVFCIRSITFTYIIYFFLVFLPYLPLSVLAIVAFGLGFLMLTPLILMVFQTKIIVGDFVYLYRNYRKRTVNALFTISILTIPIVVSGLYVKEKNILQRALRYVYEPDYDSPNKTPVDVNSLHNVLRHVKSSKERSRQERIPFLSSYYNWIVLDNLTLSDEKINYLERIFNGAKAAKPSTFSPQFMSNRSDEVIVSNSTSSSSYDENTKFWTSTIEFEITNYNAWQSEYISSFKLPDGAWINDYYLWINNEKVKGILAEKKAATWIYQQVTSYRQDPGILYYTSGNDVSFRVFPFAPSEKRITGFQIIHKEPFTFSIDDQTFRVGGEQEITTECRSDDGRAIYLPRDLKRRLNPVQRTPYYHFIIDCSTHNGGKEIKFYKRIKNFLRDNPTPTSSSFALANTYSATYQDPDDLLTLLQEQTFSGGFFLDRALKEILYKSFSQPSDHYPIIVVVTDSMEEAILSDDFKDLKLTFPESDFFYHLAPSGHLYPHSLAEKSLEPSVSQAFAFPVAAWPNQQNPQAYIRLDDHPSIIFLDNQSPLPSFDQTLKPNDWQSALTLHGQWINHTLHPENTPTDWLNLVKGSFSTQIMTPVTSFIALENDAQRKTLLKKQKETLSAQKAMDIGEEDRMSEPSFLYLVSGLLLIFLLRKKGLSSVMGRLISRPLT